MRVIVFSVIFGLAVIAFGDCAVGITDSVFEQLKPELKSQGMSEQFIKITENSIKRMILSQAKISEIKTVLLDLWKQGVSGRALKNAVTAVAELVACGDNTLEASQVASAAAHQAEAEGLSGFGVGMRVRKAVQDRKAYLKSLKEY
jgi:hypothetical protein